MPALKIVGCEFAGILLLLNGLLPRFVGLLKGLLVGPLPRITVWFFSIHFVTSLGHVVRFTIDLSGDWAFIWPVGNVLTDRFLRLL